MTQQNTEMTIQARLKYLRKAVKLLVKKDTHHKFCNIHVEQLKLQKN